jgi:hypothetical protein
MQSDVSISIPFMAGIYKNQQKAYQNLPVGIFIIFGEDIILPIIVILVPAVVPD